MVCDSNFVVQEIFDTRNGLADNFVNVTLVDSNSQLWLSSNKGISTLKLSDRHIRNFGLEDGLQSLEFNTGAWHIDKNGTMYFGGVEGLNYFNPTEIIQDQITPLLILNEVKIFDKNVKMYWLVGSKKRFQNV